MLYKDGFSIRVAAEPGTPCASCGLPTGSGPVGFWEIGQVCDVCLLEHSHQLGMLLVLMSFVRHCAQAHRRDPWETTTEDPFLSFALIFDMVMQRESGPPRTPPMPPGWRIARALESDPPDVDGDEDEAP